MYYILNLIDFNKESREPLEQWLYFLSNSAMPDVEITAPGLSEAEEAMRIIKMSPEERRQYTRRLFDLSSERDMITYPYKEAYFETYLIGKREGLEQGREEGIRKLLATAHNLKAKGLSFIEIAEITGLDMDEIEKA